jgi:NMD protein affecting ribosome stability and mRNA decay
VKEWSPNFHPQSDTIKKVAVWVRISGLPIEYYDSRVLRNIGNKIGSTVKVDKNTVMQEKGKYARLCVEVDLTKPLLAMFMIKERKYNVEYEGLHILCKTCGRFGHYSEGCPEK